MNAQQCEVGIVEKPTHMLLIALAFFPIWFMVDLDTLKRS
jgi:hypothetical protein